MGGMHGFGAIPVESNEPVFHAEWEKRVLGMIYQILGFGWANIDAFRHAIERMDPVAYLSVGYYGRWLDAAERLCVEEQVLDAAEVSARVDGRTVADARETRSPRHAPAAGFVRDIGRPARFAAGDRVRVRIASPTGHTRLPRYVAGRCGIVHAVGPACVFPDSNAHARGEDPRHLYNVRFEARELWGDDAEQATALHIDLFEPYLEPA
jgi:nitrile hydratase subunit beta